MHKSFLALAVVLGTVLRLVGQNLAGDEALSKVLIDGEMWEEVAAGFGMTDGACSDAQGNVYFADLPKAAIHKVSLDGKVSLFLTNGMKISALKFGPEGRLYACTQAPKKQVLAISLFTKKITVYADDVQPNDLVVSVSGFIYFTETSKGQVTGVDVNEMKVFAAATNLNAPNGIALSPDGGTLAVSEYRGSNVWTYRVNSDGTLDAGAPYMTLRTPTGKAESAGDGMTVDSMGRYYVTSALGIQMFDWTGRMGGVVARPQDKGTVSVSFGGPKREFLYACSTDKLYRRKMQTPGAWPFPIAP